MDTKEMENLEESYFDAARSYGIPEYYSKAVARKIVYGESASKIIELAFSKKVLSMMNLPDDSAEDIAKMRKFIHYEVPTRCIEKSWTGFKDY
ncbi:MAG: hypothetical protein E3J23_08590 [Candidatus Stahlbacteria bacterium]|nr:MAG: hypothetical protein E3J23_08590 [Candidatus Stahlbacteria bacterium]